MKLEAELRTVGSPDQSRTGQWQGIKSDLDTDVADEGEIAFATESLETNEAIVQTLGVRLNEVVAALGRIEVGTYGFCEVAGEPIENDRLMANPAATRCKIHMEK